ncbi:MAG: (2Fe-2S)-binding protein [Frankiales bacterium]|nr:(2Fe-2S)-binding protein [Frankiales bacterium]
MTTEQMNHPACVDPVALNEWYPIENAYAVTSQSQSSRLLGHPISLRRDDSGQVEVRTGERGLAALERYGFVWTSLGQPDHGVVEIAEAAEPDRRYVACGWITVRTSAPRLVENFLDMAHFPFVHADILGSEQYPQVAAYQSEIRPDVDEVWATNCSFFQPKVTAGHAGSLAQLSYRVSSPFLVMLYRVPPETPDRQDVIALLIQPLTEVLCRAQPLEYLIDTGSSDVALLDFEQKIFLQDRIIVENQRPLRLPLDPRAEIPTRADNASITYRRWLKQKGLRYGVTWDAGPPRSPADAPKGN